METYSSTSSRKGKVPQRKYPMSLKVGTKKTCRLKYNMTKTHSELFVWSESELVDVKTPTIEKGEGGAPGILVRAHAIGRLLARNNPVCPAGRLRPAQSRSALFAEYGECGMQPGPPTRLTPPSHRHFRTCQRRR
mmetsp:Transcript_99870/g.285502  ORF Transcript_99870/g.285502 Transcript_99870/m.285502 type:complete len:135 (+) Transcript_99870:241-645(+)